MIRHAGQLQVVRIRLACIMYNTNSQQFGFGDNSASHARQLATRTHDPRQLARILRIDYAFVQRPDFASDAA